MKTINEAMKNLQCNQKLNEDYTAREAFDADMKRYLSRGEDAELSKKEYKKKLEQSKYPSVSYEIADQIQKLLGTEVRVAVPGHTQRGGSPCPYDRALCTRLGAAAAKAIIEEDYGERLY